MQTREKMHLATIHWNSCIQLDQMSGNRKLWVTYPVKSSSSGFCLSFSLRPSTPDTPHRLPTRDHWEKCHARHTNCDITTTHTMIVSPVIIIINIITHCFTVLTVSQCLSLTDQSVTRTFCEDVKLLLLILHVTEYNYTLKQITIIITVVTVIVNDNVSGAVIMALLLQEFTQFIWRIWHERRATADLWTKPISWSQQISINRLLE